MSLFGTNMTAFTILGSSGHAFNNGIVTYGLMASSSGLVVPLTIFLVGTRVWALGKRFGFITPVQLFRDRWETSHIGTVIFVVQAALLVPYIVIGVMGGGTTLSAISGGLVPFWLGGAVVALVVMSYVFFGGMRGTAWVNTFQTSLFLLCIMAIWLPCVFLGAMANRVMDVPQIGEKIQARRALAVQGASLSPEGRDALRAKAGADEVLLLLLERYAPLWLAGILGAGIMAAVRSEEHTSELQSPYDLVCRLLLEKKK